MALRPVERITRKFCVENKTAFVNLPRVQVLQKREERKKKGLPIKIDAPAVSVRILAGNLSIFIVFGRYFFMIDLSLWLIYLYIVVFS